MTRPTVLITGGGGFVGSHLAEGLRALGYTVTAIDSHFDSHTRERLQGVRLIEATIDGASLRGALEGGMDMVIHGAALTTPPDLMGMTLFAHVRRNVDLLIECLDQSALHDVPYFVFLSSSGVFSFEEAEELHEDVFPRGATAYAVAKRAGEALCAAYPASLVVRLGPLYGDDERSRDSRIFVSPIRSWLDCVEQGSALSVDSPRSRRDWTFLPDLARAIDRLRSAAACGLYHLTSGEIVSDLELANLIAARRPGTLVAVTEQPGPPRVPMTSRRRELDGFSWTPLSQGLSLVAEGRA